MGRVKKWNFPWGGGVCQSRAYKVADTLIFFPTRRGTIIFSPNHNLAHRPLNIGKYYIFRLWCDLHKRVMSLGCQGSMSVMGA